MPWQSIFSLRRDFPKTSNTRYNRQSLHQSFRYTRHMAHHQHVSLEFAPNNNIGFLTSKVAEALKASATFETTGKLI